MKSQTIAALAAVVFFTLIIPAMTAAQGGGGGGGGNAAPAAPLPLGPVTGSAQQGRALYYTHMCYACHGYNGETQRRLAESQSAMLANEQNFLMFLRARADAAPILPASSMPNYPENALSDAEALDIYAYIRSFRLNAPAVSTIPTLQSIIDAASRPYQP